MERQYKQLFMKQHTYELHCRNHTFKNSSSMAAISIIFIGACVVVQQIHQSKLLRHYLLGVTGSADVHLSYSYPFTYDTRYEWLGKDKHELRVDIVFLDHTRQMLDLRNKTVTKSFSKTATTRFYYTQYKFKYNQTSYSVLLENTVLLNNTCAAFNSTFHKESYHGTMLLDISSICGKVAYMSNGEQIYLCNSHHTIFQHLVNGSK